MSPITNYPQSPNGGTLEPFSSRSKRAASPQRISNGYTSPKSNSILSPRKTSMRFFRRPTLEKNSSIDFPTQGNEKKKQLTPQPRVEIIYKDPPSENESDKDNMVSSLKKAFETDGTALLRLSSTHSGDRSPSTISEESVPSMGPSHCLDVNMNRVSTASSSSHTERVVQEIVSTEQAYVKHLQEIIKGYLTKMKRESSPFYEQDVKDLFMNIEEIYEFNKTFLAELETCGDDPVEVAKQFVSKEKGFVTYTDYCTNYPVSVEVLTKSTQKKETADFIKKIQVELGHSLPLGSYLLKPVQRILKYHLLLQDIQKHFDKESDPEGYDIISDALSAMTGVAHHINEMKRQHEVAVHVQEIQSQMSDFEGPDLTTYGSLVLEDTFRMHGTRTDRYLFLFEQILLITKRKESGYSCKATLMLSNMMMLESVSKEPLAFQIIRFDNQKITYTFLARNIDQKRKWMLELKRLIVDSLAAPVSTKARNIILGKESGGEIGDSETSDVEGKKRSSSIDSKLSRGTQLKEASNSRVLVTVTADYIDVKRLRTSFSDIYQIITQSVNNNSELDLKRLDGMSHELANRNACHWLYKTLAKQHNIEGVNSRRISDPFQETLKSKMNLNNYRVNLESLSGFSSLPRNYTYNKGSSVGFTGMKGETSRKSDDEGGPRSPSDVYSSDDDKKPVRSHLTISDREESLDESEELIEDKTQDSESLSDHRISTTINESSEDETEENSQNCEDTQEQITKYSVQGAQGEVLGTATTEGDRFAVNQDDATKEKELASNKTVKSVTRQRSGSLSRCDNFQTSRNKSVTETNEVFSDEATSERGSFSCVRSDSPSQIRRSSNSSRLLEARLSVEKSSSAVDLRDIDEDSPAVFSHNDITSFMEYSAIQTTVRKVSRAFSGTSPPIDKNPQSEAQMRTAQTHYIVESRNSPGKDTSFSSSDSSHQNLEELLASIDRDLDETRRTISCAQLLESALLVKNEGRPQATENEPTDSLRRRRRQRIIDFSLENKEASSNEFKINPEAERNENHLRDETDSNTKVYSKLERKVADFSVKTNQAISSDEENERLQSPVPLADSEPQGNQTVEAVLTLENSQPKKRVFELFADSNSDRNKQLTNMGKEASSETSAHVITPRKSTLPSVTKMARQYSRLVSDQQTVEDIRLRARSKVGDKMGSDTIAKDKQDTTDHTPKIKIEKVTKVSFTSTPIESYKLVRRRRRRSGSSRHRSDDFRRLSWSVEKVKPESDEPRKTRPKSVYDIEALEATLAENMEQIEEGLEPMLIEGLEKDDVVVRGLVQHLVQKFSSQKSQRT
ncbi:uncharacterized protein LOC144630312 isoform X2 [Oculina patagonica]